MATVPFKYVIMIVLMHGRVRIAEVRGQRSAANKLISAIPSRHWSTLHAGKFYYLFIYLFLTAIFGSTLVEAR